MTKIQIIKRIKEWVGDVIQECRIPWSKNYYLIELYVKDGELCGKIVHKTHIEGEHNYMWCVPTTRDVKITDKSPKSLLLLMLDTNYF